jgi:hypothetical protein
LMGQSRIRLRPPTVKLWGLAWRSLVTGISGLPNLIPVRLPTVLEATKPRQKVFRRASYAEWRFSSPAFCLRPWKEINASAAIHLIPFRSIQKFSNLFFRKSASRPLSTRYAYVMAANGSRSEQSIQRASADSKQAAQFGWPI